MRVFKHLVPLADIAVGFLGLFFIIFALTRPRLPETRAELKQKQAEIHQLQRKLQDLEELKLARSASGKPLPENETGKIKVAESEIRINVGKSERLFVDFDSFDKEAAKMSWPSVVVLYVDPEVKFERVIEIIDRLKQIQDRISVRIATLSE